MTEQEPELAIEPGDYDVDHDVDVVEPNQPQPPPEDSPQDEVEGLGAAGVSPYGPEEAIARARAMSGANTYVGVGLCLKVTRGYYGVNSKYMSAIDSWNAADHKVRRSDGRDIPRGVPVYWGGGQFGHIAISAGGGYCWSTDWKEMGRINLANINELAQAWGRPLLGYAWEVNDVIVWRPDEPKKTVVALHNLKPKKKNDDIKQVKRALAKKGYVKGLIRLGRFWGKGMTKAYAKYQRRLGYTGAEANGIPGRNSLEKLGFKVTR